MLYNFKWFYRPEMSFHRFELISIKFNDIVRNNRQKGYFWESVVVARRRHVDNYWELKLLTPLLACVCLGAAQRRG